MTFSPAVASGAASAVVGVVAARDAAVLTAASLPSFLPSSSSLSPLAPISRISPQVPSYAAHCVSGVRITAAHLQSVS